MNRQGLTCLLIVPLMLATHRSAPGGHSTHTVGYLTPTGTAHARQPGQEQFDAKHWRGLMKVYTTELRQRLDEALPNATDDELIKAAWVLCGTDAPQLSDIRPTFSRYLMKHAHVAFQGGNEFALGQFLWLATGLQRSHAEIARGLGDQAFSAAVRLIQQNPPRSDPMPLAGIVGEWSELVPSETAVRTLAIAIPNVRWGEEQAVLLTHLGVTLDRLGRRKEAIMRFQQAVAQPRLDGWPEPIMAARNAFIAWVHVEPEVALPKALAQLGQYQEAWGGPDTLTAVVIGHAAQEIAKTDLARAVKMVKDAPETSSTSVGNTRATAMVLLAEAIARDHPAQAEKLLEDALALGGMDLRKAMNTFLRLPRERARRVFQRHFASYYERAGLQVDMGFPSVYADEAEVLLQLDPGLIARLAKRWGHILADDPDPEGRATTNRTLTGLASAAWGFRLLRYKGEWAGHGKWGQDIPQLIAWIGLLHRLEKSAVRSADIGLNHPGR